MALIREVCNKKTRQMVLQIPLQNRNALLGRFGKSTDWFVDRNVQKTSIHLTFLSRMQKLNMSWITIWDEQ